MVSGALISVSIHAPREGCDSKPYPNISKRRGFNSRTPGGVRLLSHTIIYYYGVFQFTHPGRGATITKRLVTCHKLLFQFTHPGRGATKPLRTLSGMLYVSIHAPREGCDTPREVSIERRTGFQFTHPGRGATQWLFQSHIPTCQVSIHAPREGCDLLVVLELSMLLSFNSRTPGGVRL